MKIKFITLLALTFSCVTALFAQNPVLENPVFLRGGVSLPLDGYMTLKDAETDTDPLKWNTGSYFEIGSIFYIDDILKHDHMKIGIDATFLSAQYNTYKNTTETTASKVDKKYQNIFGAVKLGPVYSVSPAENLAFDLAIKANFGYSILYMEQSVFYEDPLIKDTYDDATWGGINIEPSFVFNIRYSVFTVGAEFRPGYMKFADFDDKKVVKDEAIAKTQTLTILAGFAF